MDYTGLPFIVEPMRIEDIDEVTAIDRLAFTTPWSANTYRSEIEENRAAHYYVVRASKGPDFSASPGERDWREQMRRWLAGRPPAKNWRPVLAYSGFWVFLDEAHISTIAVRPEYRRRGLGELLIVTMIEDARGLRCRHMTLEVRASNVGAQKLYQKFGFEFVGRRKGYYTDNWEDALLMTLHDLPSRACQEKLAKLSADLRKKLLATGEQGAIKISQ